MNLTGITRPSTIRARRKIRERLNRFGWVRLLEAMGHPRSRDEGRIVVARVALRLKIPPQRASELVRDFKMLCGVLEKT